MNYALLTGVCCLMAAVLGTGCSAQEPKGQAGRPKQPAEGPKKVAQQPPAPSVAALGIDGRMRLSLGGEDTASLAPIAATPSWQFGNAKAVSWKTEGQSRKFTMKVGDATVSGEAVLAGADGKATPTWTFTSDRDVELAALAVSMDFPAHTVIGGTWTADAQTGAFPADFGKVHLFTGPVKQFAAKLPNGKSITVNFPEPTPVLVQDNRQWGQTFSIRLGRQGTKLAKGETYTLPMTIAASAPLKVETDGPTVITAGTDWIPLKTELEIEPGSALDFSKMGFADGPAGKYGKVIVNKDGHFAFEKQPNKAQRFYGVNFCFSAHYITKEQADQLCDRLLRLGYNTIRIHHYEGSLTDNKPGMDWKPETIDQLDYLVAACAKRGIYVTTDLFVSRPIGGQQVGMPGDRISMNTYKVLVPVHEPAYKDFENFSRKLLEHVNPYTGRRWADEPALGWLSMINEGNFGNYWKEVKALPQWAVAWNKWLAKRYKDRAALAKAWGEELKANEDAAAGTVALPDGVYGDSLRHRDVTVFIGELERDMFLRIKKLVRDELRCKALLTNINAWTNHAPNQMARAEFDYVDDHFYVDHPNFLEQDWRLPSRCDNANPVKQGAPGGRGGNTLRLLDKPFTVSEYNYSGPGRFRGVGGILTGAMAAVQDWDVIWRFAYSHSRENLFKASGMGYFDLVTDPLNQAADRAAVMLYLRGDLKPAKGTVAMVLTPADLQNPPKKVPTMGEGPSWVTWVTQLGSIVGDPAKMPKDWIVLPTRWNDGTKGLTAFGTEKARLVQTLRERGVINKDNPTDAAKNIFQPDTGEMLIDATTGLLRFDTERTAGGYADPGTTIASPKAGVEVADLSIGATVFVTSVDGKPIRNSQRLLVTHLTDLQNTDCTYAEPARQVLLSWGKLPHLVRAGKATVHLKLNSASQYKVYSLTTAGKRVGEVPAKVEKGTLTFTCDVNGPDGARMLYEVAR